MPKQVNYSDEDKERALQMLLTTNKMGSTRPNFAKVSKKTGIHLSSLYRWWNKYEKELKKMKEQQLKEELAESLAKSGKEQEKQEENRLSASDIAKERELQKKNFVEGAWEGIQKAQKLLNEELDRMIQEGKAKNIGQLVTYLGVSFDKLQLLQGQPTSITALAETIAETVPEEEQSKLLQEAANVIPLKKEA